MIPEDDGPTAEQIAAIDADGEEPELLSDEELEAEFDGEDIPADGWPTGEPNE